MNTGEKSYENISKRIQQYVKRLIHHKQFSLTPPSDGRIAQYQQINHHDTVH